MDATIFEIMWEIAGAEGQHRRTFGDRLAAIAEAEWIVASNAGSVMQVDVFECYGVRSTRIGYVNFDS